MRRAAWNNRRESRRAIIGIATCVIFISPLRPDLRAQGTVDVATVHREAGGWHTVNRTTTVVDSAGQHILRYDERAGAGLSSNLSLDFADGDIDVDIRGRDVLQKSFVGIALRVTSDTAMDVVYLRPFNFRSTDPVRLGHAVQYASYPSEPWQRLRADHPGEYETAVPPSLEPNGWTHLRLSINGRDLAVFLNGAATPVLHVQTLGGRTHGGVALWVGDHSTGDFANLRIQSAHAPTTSPSAARRVKSPSVVGDLRLEELSSRIFNNERLLRVLLPDGYDAPENRRRTYPVLYMADGQNLFDPATSVFGPSEWRVDETVHQLVSEGRIPPMIIVGVDDAGRTARAHEYLPYPDTGNARSDPSYDPNPQGKHYPDFLIKEVMPYVNARYRTMHDPDHTGIGGSSYGGLISTYVVAARPGVFGRALIESPTYSVYGLQVLRDLAAAPSLPRRMYVAVGTNEDGAPSCKVDDPNAHRDAMVAGVDRMAEILRKAGLDSTRARIVIEPCATHTHAAWSKRLPAALTFLFGAP
jgi:predicted alpha/beta superfamily hydrolase